MKLHEYFSIEGAKTPYALAKFLGITPANVYDWLKNGRPIPINHCARIEKFTNNLVSCEELAPNFRWNELWNIYELRQERQLPAFFYSLPRGSLKTATVA